jgi:phi LC3 family holin
MKVNWTVRFKNGVWLASFLCGLVTFVYNVLAMFDIFPVVTENTIIQIINNILLFLSMIGVITDPTTKGLNDSQRAMSYEEPWSDG